MDGALDGAANAIARLASVTKIKWQPPTAAGLRMFYSPGLDAIVMSGGVAPGHGRSADIIEFPKIFLLSVS